MCREAGDMAGLQASLGNRAVIARTTGDLEGSLALLAEQERICRELDDPLGLQRSLGNKGIALHLRNEPGPALELLAEQEAICQRIGEAGGLQESLGTRAVVLLAIGGWHQQADIPANHLVGTETEQPLGRGAERLNQSAVVDNDKLVTCLRIRFENAA